MGKTTLGSMFVVLAGAGLVLAQPSLPASIPPDSAPASPPANASPFVMQAPDTLPPPSILPPQGPLVPTPVPPNLGDPNPMIEPPIAGPTVVLPGRCWTNADYLIWRTEHAPLNYTLVTAGTTGVGSGVANSFMTTTYFDQSNMSYQNYNGARLTMGYWLNAAETFGIEGSAFFLISHGVHFNAIDSTLFPVPSIPVGTTPALAIYRPYISAPGLTPSALLIGAQPLAIGSITINSSSSLWGGEVNFVRNVCQGPCLHAELIAGYRYLNLTEDLNIVSTSNAAGMTTPPAAPTLIVSDRFFTSNNFHGGQIGTRLTWIKDCFVVTGSARLAAGENIQAVEVGGNTISKGTTTTLIPGGFYAVPSNSGTFSRESFSIVPQVGLTLGYQAGAHCRFVMGYEFMYWSNVARPGEQLNPIIDPRQVPSLPGYIPGFSTGGPLPIADRGFWAQGVTLGLEVRY